jgi:hypothetical protein
MSSSCSAATQRKNTAVKATSGVMPAGTHMMMPPRRWSSSTSRAVTRGACT